jgi:adenylate cyclase class IV
VNSKLEIRKEYKFQLSEYEYSRILRKNDGIISELHKKRKIISCYYDTDNLNLYKESIFSDVDKYKLRIRTYGDQKIYYFEVKKNNSTGKFKTVEELKNIKKFPNTVAYKSINFYAKAIIEYEREYFKFGNSRLTVDRNITYMDSQKLEKHSERSIIIEIKLLSYSNPDIEKYFFGNPVKFSKYENAIKKLYYDK